MCALFLQFYDFIFIWKVKTRNPKSLPRTQSWVESIMSAREKGKGRGWEHSYCDCSVHLSKFTSSLLIKVCHSFAFQERAILGRIGKGFQYLRGVVKLAPGEWTAMVIRMAVKPEVHKFALDIISAIALHSSHRLQVASWLYLSRLLHKWSN